MMPHSSSKLWPFRGNLVHWQWCEWSYWQLQHDIPSALVAEAQNEFFHNTFCAKILSQNLRHSFGIPRSASHSCTVSRRSSLIAACTRSTLSDVLLAAVLPEHGSLSTDSWPSLMHLCHTYLCTALIVLSQKSFWIIPIASMEERSSLTQNLMQIHCSTCSVISNAMTTQFTCSLNGDYHPYQLVWWIHHCSHVHVIVHSPWLPGSINVTHHSCYMKSGWTFFSGGRPGDIEDYHEVLLLYSSLHL